jgi:SAM-dependent methyltransferase
VSDTAPLFDAYYFSHCCGRPYSRDKEWLDFFGGIADRIVSDIAPARVLDAGCAWGLLVEALRARGVEAWGIDVSEYAIGQVAPAVAPYCRVGSIADPLDRQYDLIVCMEVVEHMPPADSERALATFAAHTQDILFSSSPFDLREPTHVNVRATEAWAEVFARHGFFRDVDFDAGFVTPWAMRVRREAPTMQALVRRYERWAAARHHAANEARAQALDTQRALAQAESQLERLAWLEDKAAALAREVQDLQTMRADADFERERAQAQVADALGTIRAMESSAFWKLRSPWAALSRIVRGR